MRHAFVMAAALAVASALAAAAPAARADEPSVSAPPASSQGELTEARAHIEATLAQMRATSLRVRDQLRKARRRGTKVEIACVDEALSRSDVALRRARGAGDEVLAACARGDTEGARTTLRRLGELKEAQRLAGADAVTCAPRAVQVGVVLGTTVTVQVDPRVAKAP